MLTIASGACRVQTAQVSKVRNNPLPCLQESAQKKLQADSESTAFRQNCQHRLTWMTLSCISCTPLYLWIFVPLSKEKMLNYSFSWKGASYISTKFDHVTVYPRTTQVILQRQKLVFRLDKVLKHNAMYWFYNKICHFCITKEQLRVWKYKHWIIHNFQRECYVP